MMTCAKIFIRGFRAWLSPGELEDQLGAIADIAAEYGDPNIEEMYPINNNEN